MRHIILAEDEDAVRLHLKAILERSGYKVTAVSSGPAAFERVKEAGDSGQPADLLITDINMPGMSGLELLDELEKNCLVVPTVIISGSDDRNLVLEALRRGCREFIDKPFVKDDVIKKINSTFIRLARQQAAMDTQSSTRESLTDTQKLLRDKIDETSRVDKSIGNYKLLRVLGEGAIGTVFLCEHVRDKCKYAMKLLKLCTAEGETAQAKIQRFINESNAISQLNHPNIVKFVEFGYTGSGPSRLPYFVMEYFDSKTLKHYLRAPESLTMEQKISILLQTAGALQAVHHKNILHRDLKPDNILVSDSLTVKMTDFGICHLPTSDLTKTSDLMGTPGYMAPEYIQRGQATRVSDIYSLGVVAYELLVGVVPFDGDSLAELVSKITTKNPAEPKKLRPDFPDELQAILAKMLKKKPEKRHSSAASVIADLKKFGDNARAGSPGLLDKIKKGLRIVSDWS
jgi:serine/threonine protein kinase